MYNVFVDMYLQQRNEGNTVYVFLYSTWLIYEGKTRSRKSCVNIP